MFSLYLDYRAEQFDDLSFALWEAGTAGIRQEEGMLIAAFPNEVDHEALSTFFATHNPRWMREEETDWYAVTQQSWPGRNVGQKLFLAAVWNVDKTPPGRIRVIHNPGMASGTGEHPCTQLALESLEQCATANCVVVDIGTGSGILAMAALALAAQSAIGLDTDTTSISAAAENFALNQHAPTLVQGTTDCLAPEIADVVLANISGTVLLSIADDLIRIVKPNGHLILTGFPESELSILQQTFGPATVTGLNEWRCLTLRL